MSLLTLSIIHLFAVASPGPDFMVVLRETISFSLRNGIVTAIGIALGNSVLILISVYGASYLISQNPEYLRFIQVCGAAYLFFLGVQSLKSFFRAVIHKDTQDVAKTHEGGALGKSFLNGFVTTMGNPKAIIYFVSLTSQVMGYRQSMADLSVLITVLVGITAVWFIFLAILVGNKKVRPLLLKNKSYLELFMGLALIIYGAYFLLRL